MTANCMKFADWDRHDIVVEMSCNCEVHCTPCNVITLYAMYLKTVIYDDIKDNIAGAFW